MKSSTLATTTTVLGLMLAACGTRQAASPTPAQAAETKAAVEAAFNSFHQALRANDVETFMSYIADDVVLLPPGEGAVRGKSAMRTWYLGVLSQFHTSSLSFDHEEFFVGDGWATILAGFEWGLIPTAGGAPVVDRGSFLQVWKREPNGQWRFAREVYNSSVPPAASGGK